MYGITKFPENRNKNMNEVRVSLEHLTKDTTDVLKVARKWQPAVEFHRREGKQGG